MLIVSWNVAGWATTVNRINQCYKPPPDAAASCSTKKRKLHPAAAVKHFIERHQADILCLQEHKIQKQQLSNRSEPCQASSVPGFESFWSCCVDENHKGLNGVVTYAPVGNVIAADSAPLGSPDLDNQGRCLMTDHGRFCIFNVYAPNSSGHPLSFRMKFLVALRRAMQRQRDRNKFVILLGDLNISHKSKDIDWKDRYVHVQDVLDEVKELGDKDSLAQWKHDVARHWEAITSVMTTQEVVETKTTNSLTSETHDKYRLAVTLKDGRRVYLGKHETSPDYCRYCYDFSADTYIDGETDDCLPCREADLLRVSILSELMSKIAGVPWDESLQRTIASYATEPRVTPTRKWLSEIVSDDKMVDSFRYLYPTAEGRFTCWHQFTNKRYINEGARIDYGIVDQSIMARIQRGPGLRCYGSLGKDDHDFALGEQAALQAATANGLFQPASFGGEGIQTPSQVALDTQFGERKFQ